MFSRAYGTTNICLRCQLRQYRPLQALPVLAAATESPFAVPTATPPRRRLQSTAVLRVDDNGEQPHSASASAPPPADDLPSKPAKKGKKKSSNFRVWRPRPTAQLGMNALGKPSEVLLLAPRDRRIPVVPTDSGPEPKESFYEAVTSETQPSTWEQVKENISQARHQIQPQPQPHLLTAEAWAKLKKTLVAGFTKKQLCRYLEEHRIADKPLPHLPKIAGKDTIIKAIAKHVWLYDIPATQLRSTAQAADPASAHKVYLLPPYKEAKQVALTRAPVDNVLRLANKLGVSVEFGKKHTKVTGPPDQASEIRQLIQQQTAAMKTVQRHVLSADAVSESHDVAGFVDTLARKHGLFATLVPRGDVLHLNVVCTPAYEDAIDRLYHELCLAIHRHRKEKMGYQSNLPADQELVWCPDYTPCLAHLLPLSKRLYRPHPRTISKSAELARAAIGETVMPRLSISPTDSSTGQIEYTAEFGRGLFDGVKEPDAIISQKASESAYPHCAFLPTMPVLQQFLASGHLDRHSEKNDPEIITLTFSPLSAHSGWQEISIDITSPYAQHGFSAAAAAAAAADAGPRARIHRICVVEAQQSVCLLRPASVVDVKLSCRRWREVYSAVESPTESTLFDVLARWLSQSAPGSLPAAPLLFLDPPAKHPDTAGDAGTGTPVPAKDERKKQQTAAQTAASAGDDAYILSDCYRRETEAYGFRHKDRRYTVEHASLVAQTPTGRGPDTTPLYDRQTLTLRHVVRPPTAAAAAAAAATTKTKADAASTTTAGTAGERETEAEDFVGAALSLAKKWQTEAARFRQRIEMVR